LRRRCQSLASSSSFGTSCEGRRSNYNGHFEQKRRQNTPLSNTLGGSGGRCRRTTYKYRGCHFINQKRKGFVCEGRIRFPPLLPSSLPHPLFTLHFCPSTNRSSSFSLLQTSRMLRDSNLPRKFKVVRCSTQPPISGWHFCAWRR